MLLTAIAGGRRVEPTPGATATCPLCKTGVRAKCGPIVTWHWAHLNLADCDTWSEGATEWHRTWQAVAPIQRREVVIGRHRADVVTPDGTVVELQHSSIPADQIAARENHYGRMVWLFDARRAVAAGRLLIRRKRGKRGSYASFRWKHPRKSLALCKRQVLLDLGGDTLLHLKTIYPSAPCGGWGYLRSAEEFRQFINRPPLDVAG